MLRLLFTCLLVLSFNYAHASLNDYVVIDSKGKTKFQTAQVVEFLKQGNTCVMERTSVKYKSKNLTVKQCRDKDTRERYSLRRIRCADFADNAQAQACKGMKALK